jgi:hypothetical protein
VSQERYWAEDNATPVRGDDLILPAVGADSLDRTPDEIMRPAFDLLWNAFNFAHSTNYDSQGKWDPDHWKRKR